MLDPKEIAQAGLEEVEAAIDFLHENEIAEAIPYIRDLVKLWRVGKDFRAFLLAKKLKKFIADPSLQSERAKKQLKERSAKSPVEAKKVGETLFLVIDKFICVFRTKMTEVSEVT